MMTPVFNNDFSIESEVELDKTVNIQENSHINKDIQAYALVLGNTGEANATADAQGHDTTAQTYTQASTAELHGSAASSESVAATNNPYVHISVA